MRTRTTSPSINIHTDALYCKCSLLWAGFKSVRIHLLYISLSLSQFLISFSLSLSHPFLCFCPLYCPVSLPQPSVGVVSIELQLFSLLNHQVTRGRVHLTAQVCVFVSRCVWELIYARQDNGLNIQRCFLQKHRPGRGVHYINYFTFTTQRNSSAYSNGNSKHGIEPLNASALLSVYCASYSMAEPR